MMVMICSSAVIFCGVRSVLLSLRLFIPRFYIFTIDVAQTISSSLRDAGHSWVHYSVACRDLVVEPSSLWAGLAADSPMLEGSQQFTLLSLLGRPREGRNSAEEFRTCDEISEEGALVEVDDISPLAEE